MRYLGSKRLIAKHILPIILKNRMPGQCYVEPFVGGANSLCRVDGWRIAGDNNKYLIAMWQGLKDNTFREFDHSRQHYNLVRDEYNRGTHFNFTDFYIGYVGFMASAKGRFFEGGYSGRVLTKTGIVRDYIDENIRATEKKIPLIRGVEFYCCSYDLLPIPDHSIIYCDIPYKDAKKYATSGDFDYDAFWQWCREQVKAGHQVFISEHQAPDDFVCVWEQTINNPLGKNKRKRTEKLFIHKNQCTTN